MPRAKIEPGTPDSKLYALSTNPLHPQHKFLMRYDYENCVFIYTIDRAWFYKISPLLARFVRRHRLVNLTPPEQKIEADLRGPYCLYSVSLPKTLI